MTIGEGLKTWDVALSEAWGFLGRGHQYRIQVLQTDIEADRELKSLILHR